MGELLEALAAERRVWVRVAASCPASEWELRLLEVATGAAPPTWRRRRWEYRRAIFLAMAPAGRTVAGWLERSRVNPRPLSLALTLHDQVQVERRDSRFAGAFEAFPWPTRIWTVSTDGDGRGSVQGELIAADAPAFINFDQAAAEFFGLPPSPNRSFAGREIVIRDQDTRARIDSVRIGPTEIVAAVSGEDLRGTDLRVSGNGAASRRLSRATRELRLPLPGGVGQGTWLALHRGRELLDRRMLDPSWGIHPDVQIELDPTTRVQGLISRGEGPTTEFKRELPHSKPSRVMKSIAAFANAGGGSILFGVEDDGHPLGLTMRDARVELDRLTQLVSSWVRPRIDFEVELVKVNGASVIILDVASGPRPPYGVGTNDESVAYYIRRGGTSFPATPADVSAMVHARLPAPSDLYFPSVPRPRRI